MRGAHLGLAAVLVLSQAAGAQLRQQGGKFAGPAQGLAGQGAAGAVSADGKTAVVGGPKDDGGVGAAWVYVRWGGIWIQQGGKLVGSGAVGAAHQGSSVAILGDGGTVVVGGENDDGGVGAVWVWTRTGGVWTQQGPKLVGTGAVGLSRQGSSVAISAWSNLIAVGGPGNDDGAGAVWVWRRTGEVWTQDYWKKTTGYRDGALGSSLAVSADGSTILAGAPTLKSFEGIIGGQAWGWVKESETRLYGVGAVGDSREGTSVALSADGTTAIVGGVGDDGGTGAAWVFTRPAARSWYSQEDGKLVGTGAVGAALQGASVALSADGNTAILAGPSDGNGAGAVWVWRRTGGLWAQQGEKLVGSGAQSPARQGESVSMSAAGNALIGGPSDASGAGATWYFAAGQSFYALTPCRILDTRDPDGPLGGPVLAPESSRLFMMTGVCGVPADASALSANVTVTQTTAAGGLTLHPGDEATPEASTISFGAGRTRANNAMLLLAGDGTGTVNVVNRSPGSVHVIVDVNGYFR